MNIDFKKISQHEFEKEFVMKKKTGLWIDHREARIFHFNSTDVEQIGRAHV